MRSRILKPGFFDNPVLGKLDPLTRILFTGLWCYADREGRFKWEPERIRVKILPYDTRCDVPKMLDSLKGANLIAHYSVNGEEYGEVCKFKEHQRPHRRESASILPACEEGEPRASPGTVQGQSKDSPRCPVSVSVSVSKVYTPKFENLWGYYPRKIEKKAAYKKYLTTLKGGADHEDLLKATKNFQIAMGGKEQEHIKHGATFFGPNEPWKEWVKGIPNGFSGQAPQVRAPDPHIDKRCKRCLAWWSTMEKDEEGHCENCQRDLGKI